MATIQSFPDIWLISDERNDAQIESALTRLPRGSGFIYRHYHLAPEERVARWFALLRIARARGHVAVLADSALTALEWGADGIYGPPRSMTPRRDLLKLATAHSLREIGEANRFGADAVLISPAFPTRSHPGAFTFGPVRFRLLARHTQIPVIALGGMDAKRARKIDIPHWAAIDALSSR